MFKNILVPIDLTHVDESGALIEQAKQFADSSDGKLTLLNVVPEIPGYVVAELPTDLRDKMVSNAEVELRQLAEIHGLSSAARTLVVRGSPATQILETADEIKADVIVIASHQPSLSDYVLGSVAGKVVRHAHCSVVVLR